MCAVLKWVEGEEHEKQCNNNKQGFTSNKRKAEWRRFYDLARDDERDEPQNIISFSVLDKLHHPMMRRQSGKMTAYIFLGQHTRKVCMRTYTETYRVAVHFYNQKQCWCCCLKCIMFRTVEVKKKRVKQDWCLVHLLGSLYIASFKELQPIKRNIPAYLYFGYDE